MSDTFIIKKHGDTQSPHILENTDTGKTISLCSCGGSKNADATCDGTHNKKKEHGCCQDGGCCQE